MFCFVLPLLLVFWFVSLNKLVHCSLRQTVAIEHNPYLMNVKVANVLNYSG